MSSHVPERARVIPLRPAAATVSGQEPREAARPRETGEAGRPGGRSGESAAVPSKSARPGAGSEVREPLWRDLVGDVLRKERLAQERTLQDVADAARISLPYLSEVERGRKEASSEVLAAAAHALGLGLADVLGLVRSELVRARPGSLSPRRGGPAPHQNVSPRAQVRLAA